MTFTNEHIVIIGASSGIGRELAIQLSKLGATLTLCARREDVLNKINEELGGHHTVCSVDVSHKGEVKAMFDGLTKPVDRVIFMAALYKPASIEEMDLDFASTMVDVNLKGAFYVTNAAMNIFKKQGQGQLALCGSVAGYVGLPNGQPYSATKAALINFAESLYVESPKYVDIKLISPGFVETPMTEMNDFDMPMVISSTQAACAIVKQINSRRFEIHFPWRFTFILKLLALMPYKFKFYLTGKM
ncbi:MAG: short-subunit dehydrogenase [Alphaproteobacteria bacterium]|jgi:short-subunit dehydrogenase